MMNLKSLLFAPVILLMSNCTTQSQAQTSESGNNTITIGINKTAKIPNSKINLEFKNIVEDSRCPIDATCVWEGIAIVNIKASNGSETKNIQFHDLKDTLMVRGFKTLPARVDEVFGENGTFNKSKTGQMKLL